MRMDRFTTLAQQVLATAQMTAVSREHAELTPLHILGALLEDADGITRSIIAKAGVNPEQVAQVAEAELNRLPVVSGSGGAAQGQASPAIMQMFAAAEKQASALGDSYISSEHLLLALAEIKSNGSTLWNRC